MRATPLLVIRVTADHYRFRQNLSYFLFVFLSRHFLLPRYLINAFVNNLVTWHSYVPCQYHVKTFLSVWSLVPDVIYDVICKKLELTYICNISSLPPNKTTKIGRGQVKVTGHLLDLTTCARAPPRACARASKFYRAPNDFLLTALYVSGHLEHFGARAYARVFSRTPLSRPNTVVFSMDLDF